MTNQIFHFAALHDNLQELGHFLLFVAARCPRLAKRRAQFVLQDQLVLRVQDPLPSEKGRVLKSFNETVGNSELRAVRV